MNWGSTITYFATYYLYFILILGWIVFTIVAKKKSNNPSIAKNLLVLFLVIIFPLLSRIIADLIFYIFSTYVYEVLFKKVQSSNNYYKIAQPSIINTYIQNVKEGYLETFFDGTPLLIISKWLYILFIWPYLMLQTFKEFRLSVKSRQVETVNS